MTEQSWPARESPFGEVQEIEPRVAQWDMTCVVNGDGFSMTVTLGVAGARPNGPEQHAFKLRCIEQFPRFFRDTLWETAAVTVGPHRPDGDDDHAVG